MEAASYVKLPLIVSGATGATSCNANGVFFFLGIANELPFYKNLTNHKYFYRATDGYWYIYDKARFEARKEGGWCHSLEAGLGHPCRASKWKISTMDGRWVEQPAVTVATMVSPQGKIMKSVNKYCHFMCDSE